MWTPWRSLAKKMNCHRGGNYRRFISERSSSEKSQKCSCDWTENVCGTASVSEHRKLFSKCGWETACSSTTVCFLVDHLGNIIVSAFAQSVDEVLNLGSAHVNSDAVFIDDSNLLTVDITMDVYRGVRCVASLVNPIVSYSLS